jgi:sec-independent protein translocase protein TatC
MTDTLDTAEKKISGPEVGSDGQDEIDASRAPLIEHLTELRTRLIYSLMAFFGMFVVCFFFAKPIYNVLVWPFVRVVGADKAKLIATHFLEQLYTNIKLALFGAAFLSFPVVAVQIYKFVAPGLYKHERGAFVPYLIATPVLFFMGTLVVYFVVLPLLIQFSLDITPQVGGDGKATIELLPKVSEYLSLVMTLILGFGICFQLPVIMTLLARAGIFGSSGMRSARRYAIVGIAGASAVLSPPDPFSMLAMMLPTILLYEASIWIVDRVEKADKAKADKDKDNTDGEG